MSVSMTREAAEAILREAGINPVEAPLRSMVGVAFKLGEKVQALEARVKALEEERAVLFHECRQRFSREQVDEALDAAQRAVDDSLRYESTSTSCVADAAWRVLNAAVKEPTP